MLRIRFWQQLAILLLLPFCSLRGGTVQSGPTFTVTTTDAHDDGACTADDCSFQEALNAANANGDPNTIIFTAGLTGVISPPDAGGLFITSPLTIQGPGANALSFQAADKGRVFHINSSGDVLISGVAISGGNADAYNPGAPGGGIYHNGGNLSIVNCSLVGNRTSNYGGGIYHVSAGTLTVTNSDFGESGVGNSAAYGGALFNVSGSGSVTISGCRFVGNAAPNGGGAINTAGSLAANDCTFTGNTADAGGGGAVNMVGPVSDIRRCTFDSNTARYGGGAIYSYTTPSNELQTRLLNCTFWNNSTPASGGAVYNGRGLTFVQNCTITNNSAAAGQGSGLFSTANTLIRNSIVAANTNSDVDYVDGTSFFSNGYNRVGTGNATTRFTESGDGTGVTASQLKLDTGLKDNRGATQTVALLAGSALIDTGDPYASPADQRGYGRNGRADVGAFEYLGLLPVTLANISTRVTVQGGDNAVIGGFIITGNQPKRLLVRALGPSLPVNGSLANPALDVYNADGALLASNDNWRTNANAADIQATNAAPPNDAEAALLGSLDPGIYTAVERGADGGSGIGLLELYDLDRSVDSKLANISTRGLVESGDNVMIGGFIVAGTQSENLIVRALGPSLPIDGRLADPLLELYDGNGTLLAANNNWRDTQASEISATGIPPGNELESAIVRVVQPGAYTALVRGVNNSTGVALVEIYALN